VGQLTNQPRFLKENAYLAGLVFCSGLLFRALFGVPWPKTLDGHGPFDHRIEAAVNNSCLALTEDSFDTVPAQHSTVWKRHKPVNIRASRFRERGEFLMEPWRNRKALLRQLDRRPEQLRPRQAPMLAMHPLEHAHRPRHADGEAANHRLLELHGRAVRVQEHVGSRCGGRGLAPIVGGERLALAVEGEQEPAATDAGGLGFHERQYHLHGDRRVDRIAALVQDIEADLRRQRIGGDDHLVGGMNGRTCRLIGRRGGREADAAHHNQRPHARFHPVSHHRRVIIGY